MIDLVGHLTSSQLTWIQQEWEEWQGQRSMREVSKKASPWPPRARWGRRGCSSSSPSAVARSDLPPRSTPRLHMGTHETSEFWELELVTAGCQTLVWVGIDMWGGLLINGNTNSKCKVCHECQLWFFKGQRVVNFGGKKVKNDKVLHEVKKLQLVFKILLTCLPTQRVHLLWNRKDKYRA